MSCPHPMLTNGVCMECGAGTDSPAPYSGLNAVPPATLAKSVASAAATATPSTQRVNADGGTAGLPLARGVPNPSPELMAAGHVARGPVQHQADSVGDGSDLSLAGHAPGYQAAAQALEASYRDTPDQLHQQLGQVGTRGPDMSSEPVSGPDGATAPGWRGKALAGGMRAVGGR